MRNATANGLLSRILAKAAVSPVRRVFAFAFAEKTPPKEIQLWNPGDNPTDYGVHKWTARSVQMVLARYQGRGNPLLVDVEHNGAKVVDPEGVTVDADEPPVTGGYARLEVRAGTPWLVFDWSAYAVEQISTGQRRFLSPEYDVDKETGEIVGLYRVSLVADPATHHARMLASAQEKRMDPIIVAALKAALSAEDPKAAIEALLAEIDKAGGGGDGGGAGDMPEAAAAGGDAPPAPAGDKKDPPVAAAADDKKDPPVAAAAPPATQAAAPTPPAPPAAVRVAATAPTEVVDTSARAAIETLARDTLLEREGHRLVKANTDGTLDESTLRWAQQQPYTVVKSLIDGTPAKLAPPSRVQATRGATTQAAREPGSLLPPEQRSEFQKIMGTKKREKFGPHIEADGSLRVYACTPSEYRASKAAQNGAAK